MAIAPGRGSRLAVDCSLEPKGYATAEHQSAIRSLGPCPIHRRSFDYIREICGEYCDFYYELKKKGARIASRGEMSDWETEIKACAERLSEMENKKLQLMKTASGSGSASG